MIKYIKLKNTEELVGEVLEDGNFVKIKFPAKINMRYIADDVPPKTMVIPYAPHLESPIVEINKNDILFAGVANSALSEYYVTNINNEYTN